MSRDDRINADIPQRLASIVARRRRRRRATAASWAVLLAGVVVATVAACDFLLQSPATSAPRWGLTSCLFIALAGIAAWFARRDAQQRRSETPLHLARRLETHRPERGSLFSSGWAFAGGEPDDPRAGSAELRRATVMRAAVELNGLDADAELPQPPWRQALAAALVVAGVAAAVVVWAPCHVRAGLTRLTNPWSTAQWPREHVLTFAGAPTLAPRGGDFTAVLTDANGTLPATVEIQYREATGGETVTAEFVNPGARLEWRRENLQQSFAYRAVGGDDRAMTWQEVAVAPPPHITHAAATIAPPSYTGRAPEIATRELTLLAGSQVALSATFSEPVAAARLLPPRDSEQDAVELVVTNQGDSASAGAWQPQASGLYRVDVETVAGMRATTPESFLVEVIPDRPPEIALALRSESFAVLPSAALPLSLDASDDLGLVAVELSASNESPHAAGSPAWSHALALNADAPPTGLTETYLFDLRDVAPQSGDTLAVYAHAADARGQRTVSPRGVELHIVNRQQLLAQLTADLAELLETLLAAETHQREAQRQLQSLSEPVEAAAVGPIQAQQGVVTELLTGPVQSAAQLADELHFRYAVNGLQADGAAERLDALAIQLTGRTAERLQSAERKLGEVAAGLEDSADARQGAADAQRHVLEVLAAAIADFQQFSTLQQLQRDLAELGAQQRKLLAATETAARQSLTRGEPPTAAASRRAAAKQRDVLWRLASALDRMASVRDRIIDPQPMDAARLTKALLVADRLTLRELGTAAVDHLQASRLAMAADSQRLLAEGLANLLASLGAIDAEEAAAKLAELKRLAAEVAKLREQVDALAESEPTTNPDARDQQVQQAASEAAALAAKSKRAAPAAEKPLADAADALRQSSQPRAAATAVDKLAAAEAAIAAAQQQQQTLLAELRLKRLAAQVERLATAQQGLVESAQQLPGTPTESEPAGAAAAWQTLAERQESVGRETRDAGDSVADLPVFAFGLRSAAGAMDRAVAAFHAQQSQAAAVSAAQAARRRLQQVAAAVAEHQAAARGAGSGGSSTDTPQQRRESAQQQRSLALIIGQVRLLRSLQAELQQRTLEIQPVDSAAAAAELAQLQTEQAELAILGRGLLDALPGADAQ